MSSPSWWCVYYFILLRDFFIFINLYFVLTSPSSQWQVFTQQPCYSARAAQLYCQHTGRPAFSPAVYSSPAYSKETLLRLNRTFPAPSALCNRLNSLCIHVCDAPCVKKRGRKRPYRAGSRKQRSISVLVSKYSAPLKNHVSQSDTSSGFPRFRVNPENLIACTPHASGNRRPSSQLSFAVFNAQALSNSQKRSVLNHFIIEHHLDILCLTETWFRREGDEAKCKDLAPFGYKTLSFPRSTRAGGIAFVFSESLSPHATFKSDFLFDHSSFELVQFTLTLPHQCLHLFCLYRPPPSKKNQLNDSLFIKQFPNLLEYCNTIKGSSFITGDFNFHFDQPTSTYTAKLIDLLDTFGLNQAVHVPTHVRGHILDWVVHPADDNLLQTVNVNYSLPSDHYCILCQLTVTKPPRRQVYVKSRNLAAIDAPSFHADLHTQLTSSPPTTAELLNSLLVDVLDKHAPATTRKVTQRPPSPWYSSTAPEHREAKQARRQAERQWLKSGLTVHKQIFQAANNAANNIIHLAKTVYFNAKILACTTQKQLFSVTNSLLGKSCDSPLPSNIPPSDLPQLFSDFFAGKISTIRDNLDSQSPPPPPTPQSHFSGTPLSSFLPVSADIVRTVIMKSPIKTCELDPFPASLLTNCLELLLPHFTTIINNSLLSGDFPTVFKYAIVRPLLKKPSLDANSLKNYRPVSNLSFLSKITEKIALMQLSEHLQINDLYYPLQSAYRSGHSTETALLKIANDLLYSLDDDQVSLLSLLDLSAAFDTIDHTILLSRLNFAFGISDNALSWFHSYLTNRIQTVSVNGISSTPVPLKYGVPQGSVLGPVLFVLYTQPLANIVLQHSLSHHSFSDDNQLYISGNLSQLPNLILSTQACVTDIKAWMTHNKLQLNEAKTEMMLVLPKKFLKAAALPSSVYLNGCDITLSTSVRNLGITLDQTLSFQEHVSNICRTCYLELRRISSVRHLLTEDATKTLTCAFVLSRLDYCNSLLSGCPKFLLDKLQMTQNHAARLILKRPKSDHVSPLLHSLHWLPIQKRVEYKISSLCFNSLTATGPQYLSELLSLYTPSRQLRSSADTRILRIPSVRTKTYGQRSFSFQGPTVWNNLPFSLRHSISMQSFKSNLKTYLFTS